MLLNDFATLLYSHILNQMQHAIKYMQHVLKQMLHLILYMLHVFYQMLHLILYMLAVFYHMQQVISICNKSQNQDAIHRNNGANL